MEVKEKKLCSLVREVARDRGWRCLWLPIKKKKEGMEAMAANVIGSGRTSKVSVKQTGPRLDAGGSALTFPFLGLR